MNLSKMKTTYVCSYISMATRNAMKRFLKSKKKNNDNHNIGG